MSTADMVFDPKLCSLSAAGITLSEFAPLMNGEPASNGAPQITTTDSGWDLVWQIREGGAIAFPGADMVLHISRRAAQAGFRLDLATYGASDDSRPKSMGLRIGKVRGVLRYLRNGYTSWDGSYFIRPEDALLTANADPTVLTGHAMTALTSASGEVAVLGFLRHDRYQSRFHFTIARGYLGIDIETLRDNVAHSGKLAAESLLFIAGDQAEETMRAWARQVVASSPRVPRIRETRITGWCSWYSLYNNISETILLEHLNAAARFRDAYDVPLEVFQIDDGFTPEMGDWLEVKSQFPRGMGPLLSDVAAAGFRPGLWIAPFMVGNRSRLYASHPEWVVTEKSTGKPMTPMKFYGEFRWHKRSEEYYVLDVTNPAAEAYIRSVFRIWTREWGCRYFKTDFMYFGAEYGPELACWHEPGLSRMQIWMRMAELIREEIGESLWLGCGGPIWAPIGLVDAVRIGRDIGVSWSGNHSAESLLRDQTSRNFANGIFWQSDPDCILLRSRYHELSDLEVRSLVVFAGLSGGILMTSDQLDEVSEERRLLFAYFLKDGRARPCEFPELGRNDPVLVQQTPLDNGARLINVFNTGNATAQRSVPNNSDTGIQLAVDAHASCLFVFT